MSSTTEARTTAIPTGTWKLDPTHSRIGFTVVYMGVAPFEGAFKQVEATLDAEGLRGVAQASSIDVDNPDLAGHLASAEFFDVETYPELRFDAPAINHVGNTLTVEGGLEVKGNRAPITLTGSITGPVGDPWGNSKLGLELAGSVDRHDVGLTWNAPLPGGGQMLADDVTLTATLVFVSEPASS